MITPNQFNPTDSAATTTKSIPIKKQLKPTNLAAMPDLLKDKPVIVAPKKPKATLDQGKIVSDEEWFKKHPLQTEHSDGSVRTWGEDTLANKSPYLLPKQMLPPPSNPAPQDKHKLGLSDKAKGYSDYYYRKNQ